MGSKRLATLSTGEIIPATAALQRQLKKLKRVQRQMAKKQKGSTCSAALKLKLGKLHYYIKRQRQEELHQLTDYLTQNFDVITIEDLNVQGMVQNHCLARAINDAGFYEFRRQLEYKAYFRGNTLVIANRWFPSSKLCSACGTVNTELTLADREWQCACGQCHDRDLLAACNLNQYGLDTLQPDLKCA